MDDCDNKEIQGVFVEGGVTRWPHLVRNLIKEELRRRRLSYWDLAQLLRERHIADYKEVTLRRKICRGAFSASFLIQVYCALGCEQLDLGRFSAALEKDGEED